jgi:5'-3' exonuclease
MLIKFYKELNLKLVVNGELILKNILAFIRKISNVEKYYFDKIHCKKFSNYKDKPHYLDTNEFINVFQEDLIQYNKESFKTRFYNFYNINNVQNACQNYIDGIFWVWDYYNLHKHNNWTFYYQYHNTPFATDFINFEYTPRSFQSNSPFSIKKQLLSVLPYNSLLNILKELNDTKTISSLQRLSYNKSFFDIFPSKINIDMIEKQYLWQGKVLFDVLDDTFYDIF